LTRCSTPQLKWRAEANHCKSGDSHAAETRPKSRRLGPEIHAHCVGDVLGEGNGQLARVVAHIEEAAASIKVKSFDHLVGEDLRVAGAVARIIRSGSRKKSWLVELSDSDHLPYVSRAVLAEVGGEYKLEHRPRSAADPPFTSSGFLRPMAFSAGTSSRKTRKIVRSVSSSDRIPRFY
jgi:hypothetical protein